MRSIGIITCLIIILLLVIGCSANNENPVIPQDLNMDQDMPVQEEFEDGELNIDENYLLEDGYPDISFEDFDYLEEKDIEIDPEEFYPPEDEGCLSDPEDSSGCQLQSTD